MLNACRDCDQDAAQQYMPDPNVPNAASMLQDNKRIADHVAGVQGTAYTDETYKRFVGEHHHYNDTEWSRRNQNHIDMLLDGSKMSSLQASVSDHKEEWSAENAAANRYMLNQSKNYINQPASIINGSPAFLSYLEMIRDGVAFKFHYANLGTHARQIDNTTEYNRTMFDAPIPIRKSVPQHPIPCWNGDVTEGQMVRNTIDPAWKLAVRDSAQKVAADSYRYQGYTDKTMLFAAVLALLVIMPLTVTSSTNFS